jgi:hypothetical protein
MWFINEMLLEVMEYLSDYDALCTLSYLSRKRLIKYYKLKGFYNYKNFYPHPTTTALPIKIIIFTKEQSCEKINHFPKTIKELLYFGTFILNIGEIYTPIISDDVKCTFNLSCINFDSNLVQLPKNTTKLYIQCTNLMNGLPLTCNLKHLLLSFENDPIIDWNNLPPTLEKLEFHDCKNLTQPISHLPNNLKILNFWNCLYMVSQVTLPPNLAELHIYINSVDQYNKLPYGLVKLYLDDGDAIIRPLDLKYLGKLKDLKIYTMNSVQLPNNLTKLYCTDYVISNNILPISLEEINMRGDEVSTFKSGINLKTLYNLRILRTDSQRKIEMPPNLIELRCGNEFYCANIIPHAIETLHIICCTNTILNKLPKNIQHLTLSINIDRSEVNSESIIYTPDIYVETYFKQYNIYYNSLEIGPLALDDYYPKITITDNILNKLLDVQFDVQIDCGQTCIDDY